MANRRGESRSAPANGAQYPIEIPLRIRSCPYGRGDGPTLAPLSMVLKNDGTAYIENRMVMPTTAEAGGLKLQMHYMVRWTDLPMACVAISAREILDYVSPRALEDFEYELSLERDRMEEKEKEKEKAEAAKKTAKTSAKKSVQKSAQKSAQKIVQNTPHTPTKDGPKRRGRPPKAKKANTMVKTVASTAVVNDDAVEVPLPPSTRKPGGPSLSTPQKKLQMMSRGDIYDSEAVDELDDNNAVLRQLFSETGHADQGDTEMEETTEADPTTEEEPDRTPVKPPHPTISPLHGSLPSRPSASHKTPAARNLFRTTTKSITAPSQKFVQTTLTASSFMPAGRSSGRWHKSPTPGPDILAGDAADVANANTPVAPNRKRKRAEPEPAEEGEPVYVVKRLEGYKIVEVDGTRERYFKVRWEGNWPPDQNPTWEPEDNLPRTLVKKYLKKKGKATVSNLDAEGVGRIAKPSSAPRRKYSSVAEAFKGEIEEDVGGYTPEKDDGEKEEEERLLVEEDGKDEESSHATPLARRPARMGRLDPRQALGLVFYRGNGNGTGPGHNNRESSDEHY